MARFVALRHHDARVGGSIPGLGSFKTVTFSQVNSVTMSKEIVVDSITGHTYKRNTVQALKYPLAHAVTLYMPGFKANN